MVSVLHYSFIPLHLSTFQTLQYNQQNINLDLLSFHPLYHIKIVFPLSFTINTERYIFGSLQKSSYQVFLVIIDMSFQIQICLLYAVVRVSRRMLINCCNQKKTNLKKIWEIAKLKVIQCFYSHIFTLEKRMGS